MQDSHSCDWGSNPHISILTCSSVPLLKRELILILYIFHENLCEILNGLWIIGFHELSMRQSLMGVFLEKLKSI